MAGSLEVMDHPVFQNIEWIKYMSKEGKGPIQDIPKFPKISEILINKNSPILLPIKKIDLNLVTSLSSLEDESSDSHSESKN